ncbi:MAG: hypothetical protein WAQ05_07140 [Rubrivivax sp.]
MPDTAQANNRAVDSAVQPCPLLHFFSVELKPSDLAKAKPEWWPAAKGHPYSGVKAKITLGGVAPAQTLNSRGRFRIDGIAGGSASVDFEAFYADIETALEDGRKFSP